MTLRPWDLPEQLDEAEESIVGLFGVGLLHVMRPRLRAEHEGIVERIDALPWNTASLAVTSGAALSIVIDTTTPGGAIDPADDHGDVPWALALAHLHGEPKLACKLARRWFAYLERQQQGDVPVSTVPLVMAAYAVAMFEDRLGHEHEASWWIDMSRVQAELTDEQP